LILSITDYIKEIIFKKINKMTRYLYNSKTGMVKHPDEIERDRIESERIELLVKQNITIAQKMKLSLFDQIDSVQPGYYWYFVIGHVVLKIYNQCTINQPCLKKRISGRSVCLSR